MIEQEEKQRKRKAWATSVGMQVVLLVLFYFLIAWKEPFPPNPEFGIELNFGQVQTGGGAKPVQSQEVSQEDEIEQSSTQAEEVTPVESTETNEPVDPVKVVDNPNPDVSQKETTSSAKQQTETKKVTENNQKETKDPASTDKANETNPSQGDNEETGDQGNPEGDINEEALYGEPGGGDDGSTLQMSGWEWDAPPKPNDKSQESGKIVFEIVVDADGYLTSYKVLTTSVSPSVVQQYSLAVEQLTFSKTSSYKPAPSSKGILTFIIRSR